MSMISELVKELRNEAQEVRLCSNECESAELLDRAADTIEMLSEKARADRPQGENLLEKYPSLFECSVCGASCFDTIPWDCNINYCPNCGARMSNASNASNTLETLEKGETE